MPFKSFHLPLLLCLFMTSIHEIYIPLRAGKEDSDPTFETGSDGPAYYGGAIPLKVNGTTVGYVVSLSTHLAVPGSVIAIVYMAFV